MKSTLINSELLNPSYWTVIYTRSNYERRVTKLLSDQGIISFCPLIKTSRKWSDRSKVVEQPLFKSYIFVYINQLHHAKVQDTTGVIAFVKHCGKAVTVTSLEIDRIKTITNDYSEIIVVDTKQFNRGDRISITKGPLSDLEGEIVDIQNTNVLMVLDQLGCSIIVKVSKGEVLHSGSQLSFERNIQSP